MQEKPKPPPPPPPPPEELDRMLRAVNWEDVRVRLFKVAFKITHSRARSEELADTVIVDCYDPLGAQWNPNERPDPLTHALRVLKNVMSAARKKHRVRTDPRNIATVQKLSPRAIDPATALERAQQQARDERVMARARARLLEPLDRDVLDLSIDGVDKPADQAARLGRSVEDIRRARERVKYALRAAIEEDEAAS